MVDMATTVKQMARKLQVDIVAFGRMRAAGKPQTFPKFRDIRDRYRDIVGLIFSIEERIPYVKDELPANMAQWTVRQKLNALAIFTDISYIFIKDPPLALTSSLGATDLLNAERDSFTKSLEFFDMMLFEAGIDDKTADELDATRGRIEEILKMIDNLLLKSPKVLQEF